jgi:predicted  nucleic acid-binding Zn-ribbon protein
MLFARVSAPIIMAVSYAHIIGNSHKEELDKKDAELNEFRKRENALTLFVEGLNGENKMQRTTIMQLNKQMKASTAGKLDELQREAKAEMREIVAVKGEMIAVRAEMAAMKEAAKEQTAEMVKMREAIAGFIMAKGLA